MKIPFVDLQAQYRNIKPEIDQAIHQILDSSSYILGRAVNNFESAFATAHCVKHCLGVSSGTDALHLILWALGIGRGDEIITTPNTFIATVEAILLVGAKPVFVDISEDDYNIDVQKIEVAISPKTKAILPIHLYGQSCDLGPILEVAKRHDLWVIEDACQAHLAEYHKQMVGSFGIAGAFSFYPGKNLGAYGEAGAIVTNDNGLYSKLSMLRDHGQGEKYYHEYWGHNYRMEGIQGAVLDVKLKHLPHWTNSRRENAKLYDNLLLEIKGVRTPIELDRRKHVYHLYVIRHGRRNELKKYLEDRGISTGLHYPVPLHLQKGLSFLGYHKGDFPVTELVAKEILSLPMFPELTKEQIHFICDSIREFVR